MSKQIIVLSQSGMKQSQRNKSEFAWKLTYSSFVRSSPKQPMTFTLPKNCVIQPYPPSKKKGGKFHPSNPAITGLEALEVCCRGSVFDATAQAFTKAFYRVRRLIKNKNNREIRQY